MLPEASFAGICCEEPDMAAKVMRRNHEMTGTKISPGVLRG